MTTKIYIPSFGVVTNLDGTPTIDENRFRDYFEANPEHFAAVTTSMVRTGDVGVTAAHQQICLLQVYTNFHCPLQH